MGAPLTGCRANFSTTRWSRRNASMSVEGVCTHAVKHNNNRHTASRAKTWTRQHSYLHEVDGASRAKRVLELGFAHERVQRMAKLVEDVACLRKSVARHT